MENSNLIKDAYGIPVGPPNVAISVNPIKLPSPYRGRDLELRITAPATGNNIPIVLFSHGAGPSLYIPSKDSYGPIVDFYAQHGLAVIQPSHANAKTTGLDPGSHPDGPFFWRSRIEDHKLILDSLDVIEAQAPHLAGRLDRTKVAVVGHSLGGNTVAQLLGARMYDPAEPSLRDVSFRDPRISAGVILTGPGNGGSDLSPAFTPRMASGLNIDFTTMDADARALVVAGDEDASPHAPSRGIEWHADAFRLGPSADRLLWIHGGKHGCGGIAGYDAKETDDEDPERLAVTLRMTWAYLWSALMGGDAWEKAAGALKENLESYGHVEVK